jgi:hypothetical protein
VASRESQDDDVDGRPTTSKTETKTAVEGVDADYLRKLEEQKLMRETIIKEKERKRLLVSVQFF